MITRTIYLKGTSQEKPLLVFTTEKPLQADNAQCTICWQNILMPTLNHLTTHSSVTIISPLMCSSIPVVSIMRPCAPQKGLLTPCCLLAMAQTREQTTGY